MKPYMFTASQAIIYPVIIKKGIVRAERGDIRDKSPYLNALRVVIAHIQLSMLEASITQNMIKDISLNSIKKTVGSNIIKAKYLPHKARLNSST